jgi:hypothetical protein
MQFLITKIRTYEAGSRSIEMTLSPITGIHPSFIKLADGYYIGSSELKKRGYKNIIPPYMDFGSKKEPPIYLEFVLNIFLKSDHKEISKKEIGNIEFKKPRDDMAHNYEYDHESLHLQGNVYFDDEVFNNLYANLIKKTFPAIADILVDNKYTEPYDHYSKPYTPWDLSSLKYSSRSNTSNDQVKIDYMYFKYDLLNTSDIEILKEQEKIADELNTAETSYLWKNISTEKSSVIEKNLSFISLMLFTIVVILVVVLIFK